DRAAAENPLCSTTAAKNTRSLRSCKRSSSRQDGIVPQKADYLIWRHLRVKPFPNWNSMLSDPRLQSAVDVPTFRQQVPFSPPEPASRGGVTEMTTVRFEQDHGVGAIVLANPLR